MWNSCENDTWEADVLKLIKGRNAIVEYRVENIRRKVWKNLFLREGVKMGGYIIEYRDKNYKTTGEAYLNLPCRNVWRELIADSVGLEALEEAKVAEHNWGYEFDAKKFKELHELVRRIIERGEFKSRFLRERNWTGGHTSFEAALSVLKDFIEMPENAESVNFIDDYNTDHLDEPCTCKICQQRNGYSTVQVGKEKEHALYTSFLFVPKSTVQIVIMLGPWNITTIDATTDEVKHISLKERILCA